jgi:hypothetical protein
MSSRGKALAGIAAFGLGVFTTGLAYASTPEPTVPLVVRVDASDLVGIFPGSARHVAYTITNPAADRAMRLHDPGPEGRVQGSVSVDRAHPACDSEWFSFTPQGNEAATYGPSASWTYRGEFEMRNAAVDQDVCKGARISLTVTVSG